MFLASDRHIGASHRAGVADVCPACWRESLETPEDDAPYLDAAAVVLAALGRALRAGARVFWSPRTGCPRCGDVYRGTYEWSCRYPLAVALCDGMEGPHVHSVCYRCGYETVRLQSKTPPVDESTRGVVTPGR